MSEDLSPDSYTLLNTDDLAERLSLSSITIKKWRSEGKGPRYLKLGKSVRYRPKDLKRWLDTLDEST